MIALAVSLGRSSRITVALTKNAVEKVKSHAIALGGFLYALDQSRLDNRDPNSSFQDDLSYCAIAINPAAPADVIFKNKELGDGHFDVSYAEKDLDSDTIINRYGMMDEERKINLNALTIQNHAILSSLITLLGTEQQTADRIAYSVLDWKDSDDALSHKEYGAEDDFYTDQAKPYHCKNLPFDSIEELQLVQGMTPEIFARLKPYVTVYPKTGDLKINFETAPAVVLQALARSYTGSHSNTKEADADSLADKIISFRKGEDSQAYTADDRVIDINAMPLMEKETAILLIIGQFRTMKSDYVRIRVKAKAASGISSTIESVVSRNNLAIMSWQRH